MLKKKNLTLPTLIVKRRQQQEKKKKAKSKTKTRKKKCLAIILMSIAKQCQQYTNNDISED